MFGLARRAVGAVAGLGAALLASAGRPLRVGASSPHAGALGALPSAAPSASVRGTSSG